MTNRATRSLIASMAVFVLGCAEADLDPRFTVVDSAGVRLVSLELGSVDLDWSLDTLVVIGGEETGPGSFYRVSPAYVDVHEDEIFVLDRVSKHVEVFASDGTFRRAFAREGQGPGELEFPVTLAVSNRGVEVLDQSKSSIQRFTLAGDFVQTSPYPYATIHLEFRHFDVSERGRTVWRRDHRVPDAQRMDRLVVESDGEEAYLVAPATSQTSTAEYPECGMTYTIGLPLSGRPRWSHSSEITAVSSVGGYRLEVFERDKLRGRIFAPEHDRELTEQEAIQVLRERDYVGPCNATAAEVISRHGYSSIPPAIAGVVVGPGGVVWVKRADRAGGLIDVFTPQLELVGSLPASFPLPLAFLDDGRALIELRDEMDVERVAVVLIRIE